MFYTEGHCPGTPFKSSLSIMRNPQTRCLPPTLCSGDNLHSPTVLDFSGAFSTVFIQQKIIIGTATWFQNLFYSCVLFIKHFNRKIHTLYSYIITYINYIYVYSYINIITAKIYIAIYNYMFVRKLQSNSKA